MTYWTDDRALDMEQRRLDAEQARAMRKMEAPMNSSNTKQTHTAGPWKVARDGKAIHSLCGDGMWFAKIAWTVTGERNEADARLIAAAPTMKADIDEFMRRLGPRWFLEQNWFPSSVAREDDNANP